MLVDSIILQSLIELHDAGKPWDECSTVDQQANGIAKVPILVARFAGKADLLCINTCSIYFF
jgi:hypothetical protein